MPSDLEWSSAGFENEPLRVDRFPLMRPVQYERTDLLSETASREGHNGTGLSINVSSKGLCLLMDWEPQRQEVLRVHVPMPIALSQTPTLAEVCWTRPVPMGQGGLYFVGMKFVL
ncbi:MAG: PilZ domain-containing protein [Nitrospirae bacterium]|nr:MAG: PilZ domain-containing protein [Nitrospirota bacterium]